MEVIIDTFDNTTGWTASDPALVLSQNGFQSHIISGTSSLKITVPENSDGLYFEKVYDSDIDVSAVTDLRFFMSKYNSQEYAEHEERDLFTMKFSVGNTVGGNYSPLDEWYVPIVGKRTLDMVNVELDGITSFNTIRFEIIGNSEEIWWLDWIIGCKDEFVIDSLLAIKTMLDKQIRIPLGSLPVAVDAGDKTMQLPDYAYVSRYSLLEITEGDNTEYHLVTGEVSQGEITFEDETYFDGGTFLTDFSTSALVYLVVPAIIASTDVPIVTPGIYLSGIVPVLPPTGQGDTVFDSYKVSTNKRRLISPRRDLELPVQIEVRAVQPEMMVTVNNYIQKLFSDTGTILVNGRKYDLMYEDTPKYDPGDLEGDIPFTIHFYSVQIIDILNAEISYVTIPASYNHSVNFD